MTNDRAAEIMKAIIFIIPHEYYSDEVEEAIHMAINALKAQDLNKQVTGKLNSADDTISRAAAIEAVEFGITYAKAINKSTGEVKELFKEGNKALNEAVERLKELPSAQPEPCNDADKLKRCKFEYINACKIVACPTPDTNKSDIYDAYAVIKALHPIFGDEDF